MAAKINKFRKVVKKAGEFVAPTKGFDPEEYARKLTKMEDPVGDKAFVEREEMEEYVGKKVLRGGYDDDDDDRKKVPEESEEEKEDEKNVHARGARKARAFGGKKVGKRGKETIVAREKGVARCEESGEDGNVDDEFFARRGVGGERGRGR